MIMAMQRLSIIFLTFTGALASAYKDIPLEVIPIVDPPPINTPTPLLLPVLPNCEQFHLINPGETCDGISSSVGMSVQDLKSLNPYFKSGSQTCAENLLAGYWMCVKTLPIDHERLKGNPRRRGLQEKRKREVRRSPHQLGRPDKKFQHFFDVRSAHAHCIVLQL